MRTITQINHQLNKTDIVMCREETGIDGASFCLITPNGDIMRVIASCGMGWDHVSASLQYRTPTWAEMCWLKDIFWPENETVIQYHPAESQYVNNHRFCLHLWRPQHECIPLPPPEMVGIL